MVERSPATVTKPVRTLGAAVHDLRTERHEPDKPRGLRPDLWGTAGEIPAVYPALSQLPQFTPIGVAQFSPMTACAIPIPQEGKLKGTRPAPLRRFRGGRMAGERLPLGQAGRGGTVAAPAVRRRIPLSPGG